MASRYRGKAPAKPPPWRTQSETDEKLATFGPGNDIGNFRKVGRRSPSLIQCLFDRAPNLCTFGAPAMFIHRPVFTMRIDRYDSEWRNHQSGLDSHQSQTLPGHDAHHY